MKRSHMIGFMRSAISLARMSNCHRAKYCSIIVDSRERILATGRNGKPQGSICDGVCFRENLPPDAHAEPCCLHSEINCLIFANFSDIQGGTMFVTGIPCTMCALAILQSGIAELVCLEDPRGYKGLTVIDQYQGKGLTSGRRLAYSVLSREEVESG